MQEAIAEATHSGPMVYFYGYKLVSDNPIVIERILLLHEISAVFKHLPEASTPEGANGDLIQRLMEAMLPGLMNAINILKANMKSEGEPFSLIVHQGGSMRAYGVIRGVYSKTRHSIVVSDPVEWNL